MKIGDLPSMLGKYDRRFQWHVDWEITKRCDNHCVHCYLQKTELKQEVPVSTAILTIDKLKEIGAFEIGFTGGEPFLYDGFEQILEHTRDKGIIPIIYTSGNNIDDDRAKLIRECRTARVEITFLGGCKETHNKLTRNDRSFDNLLTCVQVLKKYGVNIVAKMMVMNTNYNGLNLFIDMCKEYDMECKHDSRIWKPYYGDEKDIDQYRLCGRELCDYYHNYPDKVLPYNSIVRMCTAGRKKLAITSEGNVIPCGIYGDEVVCGNIVNQDVDEIWYHSKVLLNYIDQTQKRYHVTECLTCDAVAYCEACPAMSAWGGVALDTPYKKVCEDAMLRKQMHQAERRQE